MVAALGCGTTDADLDRPSRPVWECPTPAYSPVEKGTGIEAGSQQVTLRWYVGDDPGLEGYQIYRRTANQPADTMIGLRRLSSAELLQSGTVISWSDPLPTSPTVPTYYVLFAYNENGIRSLRSDTVGFMPLPLPVLESPAKNAVLADQIPLFTFHPDVTTANSTGYVVRVRADSTSKEVLWVSNRRAMTGLTWDELQSISYGIIGNEGYLIRPVLRPGKYEWRVDFLGTHRLLDANLAAPCRCIADTFGCADDISNLPDSETWTSPVRLRDGGNSLSHRRMGT